MEITVIRIDDRLIHGQIITKWIAEARAEQILVVDEKSAADPMLRMILALAASCAKMTIKAVPEERGKELKILQQK